VEHTPGGKSTFTVTLSLMCARERLPVKQMPGSEVHNKTMEVIGFTVQQVLFESVGMCKALHS